MTDLETKVNLCTGRITEGDIKRYVRISEKYSRLQSIAGAVGFSACAAFYEGILSMNEKLDDLPAQAYVLFRSCNFALILIVMARAVGFNKANSIHEGIASIYHALSYLFKVDRSKKVKHLEKVVELSNIPSIKHSHNATVFLNRGDYEQAIEEYLLMFSAEQIMKSRKIKKSFVDLLMTYAFDVLYDFSDGLSETILRTRVRLRNNPSLISYLELTKHYIYRGKFDKVKTTLLRALSTKEASQIGPRLLIAEFLDNSGHRHEAEKIFGESLEDILKNPDVNLVPFGKSRHEVSTDKYSFVVKRDDSRSTLAKEYYIINQVRAAISRYAAANGLDKEIVKVSNALAFVEHTDEKFYLILKRKRINDAEKELPLIDENSREVMLKNILDNLATVTALVTPLIGNEDFKGLVYPHDYMQEIDRRLVSRLGNNGIYLQRFLSQYERLTKKIQRLKEQSSGSLDFFTHGDAFLSNFLANGTILDLESVVIADPTRDPATFLEHPLVSDQVKKFWYYISVLQNLSQFKVDEMALGDLFMMNRITNSMCQVGSKVNQNKFDQARFYFYKAQSLAAYFEDKKLGISFLDYITHTEQFAKIVA